MKKNRPVYRRFIYSLLTVGLFLFGSCQTDDFSAPSIPEGDALVFEVKIPQAEPTAAQSRATAVLRENLIQTLDVLAFDAELRKLMAPVGNSSRPVGRSVALVAPARAVADKLHLQYAC